MKKLFFSLLAGAMTLTASSAFAGDYTIVRADGGNFNIVQGREYPFRITSSGASDPVRITFSGSSPGVSFIPSSYQIGSDTFKFIGGEINVTLFAHGAPGSLVMFVTNVNDPGNVDSITLNRSKRPTQMTISPNPPTLIAGQAANMTIQVKDVDGNLVQPFEDDVQVTNLTDPTGFSFTVAGTNFSGGEATINQSGINVGDFNNLVDLELKIVGVQYCTPTCQPDVESNINDIPITPGPMNKLAMLYPGEGLNTGSAKSGTVQNQVAGNAVSRVDIWALDQWFNPIRATVNKTVTFTSNVGGDTMPGPINMISSPYFMLSGGPDEFLFATPGQRTITATANTGESNTSIVPVLLGSNVDYELVLNTPQPYTTDTGIQLEIRAKDPVSGNILTDYDATVDEALRADFPALGLGGTTYADTNIADLIPQNSVTFSNGIANATLNVTLRANDSRLCFRDINGNEGCTTDFPVSVGALNKIHLTILGTIANGLNGELHTPGIYPGNSGNAPTIVAGEEYVVEARLTDAHWNVFTSTLPTFSRQANMNSIVPDTYIISNPVNQNFDGTGVLLYDANPTFDKSFRVTVRTAGSNRKFNVTSDFGPPAGWDSSEFTVNAGAYSRIIVRAPGETLRPGSTTEPDFKDGTPSNQAAGTLFGPVTVYATDSLGNPIGGASFPSVVLGISPSAVGSFVSGHTLGVPIPLGANSRDFQVQLEQTSDFTATDGPRSETIQIQTGFGPLDSFRMIFNTAQPYEAGVPYNVTIEALDAFNNVRTGDNGTVDLTPTTGAGTMSPQQVTLVNGAFTGNLTNFAAGTDIRIEMRRGAVSTDSSPFTVNTNSLGFQKVLLLGPDEIHAPGTATGKTNSNSPRTVGTGVTVKVLATDLYFNKLTISGPSVNFTSNDFHLFSPNSGNIATGEFQTTFVMHAAVNHTLTVDAPAQGFSSTTTIQGNAANYARLLLLLPGEVQDPGNVANSGKDPANPKLDQKVSVQFPVTIRAVDQFFNSTTYNGGDTVLAVETPNSLLIPANNAAGGPTPRAFVNGEIVRNVLVGEQGNWDVIVTDQLDLTKTQQTVEVQVNPGPTYDFVSLPANATAGSAFPSFTIRLQEGGVPVAGYNESIFLEPYFPSGGEATGNFNGAPDTVEYVMTNGQVTINNLSYAYVENIVIRITDNFQRVVNSPTVQVDPSGLKYRVTVPATAVAGPPTTFPVTVELLDQATETLVTNVNYNHTIGVAANSLLNPPAAGTLNLSQAPLNQGRANLLVSYSKAEEIQIEISLQTPNPLNGHSINNAFSNSILITPDTYKKLLILAPGETHTPGLYQHATGKTGTPLTLDKSVPQVFQVRGVDQHWNSANYNGGQILYTADDGSTTDTHPINQRTALVNGQHAAAIEFNTAGNVTLTVSDDEDATIVPQSVIVPVAGTYFDFIQPAQTNSGAPFSMTITLKDTTGNTVPANGPITLQAMKTDGTPAEGVLDVEGAVLSNGVVTIANQSYTIAEDIRIKVTGEDTTTTSPTISFVPRAIFYIYETIPGEAEVNSPFSVVIRAIDQDTGTKVVNFNRAGLPLQAFSAVTGLLATGNFQPNQVNIVNGVGTIQAVYDQAETIFLVLTDNTTIFDPPPLPTQNTFPSPSTIRVKAGPLASVENVADVAFQSHLSQTVTYTARDAFNNIIPDQTLIIRVNSRGPGSKGNMTINGQVNSFSGKTDSNGNLVVTYAATPDSHGKFEMLIEDGDIKDGFTTVFNAEVLGLNRGPSRIYGVGELSIPVGNNWVVDDVKDLVQQASTSNGQVTSYFRVDGGQWQTYDASSGINGQDWFMELRTYFIEWYSIICYPNVDPTCANPVNELVLNGGVPNSQTISTYAVEDKLTGYPSPFNPKMGQSLTIQFPLPTPSSVETKIYDPIGREVWTNNQLVNPETVSGSTISHGRVFWSGVNDDNSTVGNGAYHVVIRVGATGAKFKTTVMLAK